MKERGYDRLDRYLRLQDTPLARSLQMASPAKGERYNNGLTKRAAEDIFIAAPLAVITTPIVSALARAKKIEDGGPSFYHHERIGKYGKPIKVVKIRTLVEQADKDDSENEKHAYHGTLNDDPRSTPLGRLIRKYGLDELSQLWQVVKGDLSLVGPRAIDNVVVNVVKDNLPPKKFKKWHDTRLRTKPGLFNIISALNPSLDNPQTRYRLESFYAEKASLGFDLYLLFRTFTRPLYRRGKK